MESYQQTCEQMRLQMLRTKNILEGYSLKEALNSDDYMKNDIRAGQTVLANWIRLERFHFLKLSVDSPGGSCINYPHDRRWHIPRPNGESRSYNELAEPTINDEYFVRLADHRGQPNYIDGYDHLKSLITGLCLGSDEIRFFANKMKIDLDKNPEKFATVIHHAAHNMFASHIIGVKHYTEDEIRAWTKKITNRINPLFNLHTAKEENRLEKALKISKKLLKEWLTPSEYRALMNNNLKIKSQIDDNTTYIVRRASQERVQIVRDKKIVGELCLICTENVPEYDRLLNKILLLKTNEKHALKVANIWNR